MTSIEHSTLEETTSEAMALLQKLIAIPSVSRDEEKAADLLENRIGRKITFGSLHLISTRINLHCC